MWGQQGEAPPLPLQGKGFFLGLYALIVASEGFILASNLPGFILASNGFILASNCFNDASNRGSSFIGETHDSLSEMHVPPAQSCFFVISEIRMCSLRKNNIKISVVSK